MRAPGACFLALLLAAGCDGSIAGGDDGPLDSADAGADRDGAPVDGTCSGSPIWECDGDDRIRCVDGAVERQPCERGCLTSPHDGGDAECISGDDAWACGSSEYQGQQYWTCTPDTGELHYCDDQGPVVVSCPDGCLVGPLATDDSCLVPGDGEPIPMPQITFVIEGGLFAEADVRAPVEQGVRYLLDRVATHIDVPPGRTVPDITVYYSPSGNTYCSGIAYADYTEVYCPRDYPLTGPSQNYVVNITIHEIGHIVAAALLAPSNVRDTCTNEGIATWMAGRYWMAASGEPVDSLRDAARAAIATGNASATMYDCVSASDNWYKVYGSYFEYLESIPGAIYDVSVGATDKGAYTDGWSAWLTE